MTDAFAGLVNPIIAHVADLRERIDRGEHPPIREENQAIKGLIDSARQRCPREHSGDLDLALYALIYWADDVLITSDWKHAEDWKHQILEWDYFRTNIGGEDFYEKAKEAERRAGTDPLEVFFLCAALGFRGRKAFELDKLQEWGQRSYARIQSAAPAHDRPFEDDGREDSGPGLQPLPGPSVLLAMSILVSATAIVTALAFMIAVWLRPEV